MIGLFYIILRDVFVLVFYLVPLPPLPPLPDTPPKTYIDPLIYVDIVDAVQEFANEIDPQSLMLESLIGEGETSIHVKLYVIVIINSFY